MRDPQYPEAVDTEDYRQDHNPLAWRPAPIGLVRVVPVGIVLLELGDQRVNVG